MTTLSGASITEVSGTGSVYTVTVNTGVGSGTIRLDVVDNDSIVDVSTNPLGGAFATGQAYNIVKTPTFADVPASNKYYTDIEILYANNLTAGCGTSPLKYCPDQILNRAQTAVFMLRANFGPSYVPPVPTHIFKDDWTKGLWAEGWAEGMRNEGYSAGCLTSPLKYCPWDQIPREQAVIFILKIKYGKDYIPPVATGTVFADMKTTSYYATAWAEQAYKEGLIENCGMTAGKPNFCPKALVSRGLVAHMIVKAKNLSMP
jgi:hypothetical protein